MDENIVKALGSLEGKIDCILQRMDAFERSQDQQWNEIKAIEKRVTEVEKQMIKHVSEHDTVEKQSTKSWRVADVVLAFLMLLAVVLPLVIK